MAMHGGRMTEAGGYRPVCVTDAESRCLGGIIISHNQTRLISGMYVGSWIQNARES